MADLSNLLGDVYGDPAPEPVPAPEPPAWANDSRLDEAFADWTPEPLEAVVAKASSSSPPSAPLDDDLAAALSAALADAPRAPVTAPPVERFSHVDAGDAVLPPVVDGATLERVPDADSIVDALDAIIVAPPTPVADAPKKRGLSLSLTRPRKAVPEVGLEPMGTEPVPATARPESPVVTGAARPWQPSDDDILPARTGGGGKSVSFRLR